jgi:hypothetical protein
VRGRAVLARLAAALFLFLAPSAATAQSSVADIPLAGGAKERVLFIGAANPAATLVMLAGNFLIRTRALWAAQGFAIEILGSLDDKSLNGERLTTAYTEAIGRAVDFARRQVKAPVWPVGTSNGTIAAVNGGARLGGKIAGVVLTSSVTRSFDESVFKADLGAIAVPMLIVANRGDTCLASPPEDAPRLAAALARSPKTGVMLVDSNEIRSAPCEAFSPHGYYGIESEIVARIAAWVRAAGPR